MLFSCFLEQEFIFKLVETVLSIWTHVVGTCTVLVEMDMFVLTRVAGWTLDVVELDFFKLILLLGERLVHECTCLFSGRLCHLHHWEQQVLRFSTRESIVESLWLIWRVYAFECLIQSIVLLFYSFLFRNGIGKEFFKVWILLLFVLHRFRAGIGLN